jgi:hypothetical protein
MNQDEKLDEALKGTFPASDAFYLAPNPPAPQRRRDADDSEARPGGCPPASGH